MQYVICPKVSRLMFYLCVIILLSDFTSVINYKLVVPEVGLVSGKSCTVVPDYSVLLFR